MNQLHIVMNGKGGIGKSIVAFNIAQFLKSIDPDSICIDTDPLTPTLVNYKALDPIHIQIASETEVILTRFDEMIEIIIARDNNVVIDTGASTFLPIAKYLQKNFIFKVLHEEYEKDVFIHVVLNAQTQNDYLATTSSLEIIAENFAGACKIVIWLNEFGGDLEPFLSSDYYERNKDRFFAIIRIRNPDEMLLGDIKSMLQTFQLYDEVLKDSSRYVMARSRIKKQRDSIYRQLEPFIV
ncbi:MAG: hypothetical protein EOP04_15840 [Proteobacteria bacterium]|nr:MAG: hypothetical protein EOP04_15840 [Pseudomonadota bacterium]